MLDINTEQVITRLEEKVLVSEVGNEIIMMDLENGNYLNVNAVGTSIWSLLQRPSTAIELADQLMQLYAVDEAQCKAEVHEFLSLLESHGLIKIG